MAFPPVVDGKTHAEGNQVFIGKGGKWEKTFVGKAFNHLHLTPSTSPSVKLELTSSPKEFIRVEGAITLVNSDKHLFVDLWKSSSTKLGVNSTLVHRPWAHIGSGGDFDYSQNLNYHFDAARHGMVITGLKGVKSSSVTILNLLFMKINPTSFIMRSTINMTNNGNLQDRVNSLFYINLPMIDIKHIEVRTDDTVAFHEISMSAEWW